MSRTRFPLPQILPLLFVLPLTVGFLWKKSSEGPIVVYLVDTLRPDRMSVYGGARNTSPAAVEFSREAAVFTNAFAVSTWTRPSVATLLTSLLPTETMSINRFGRLDGSVTTLPALFQEAGWRTAAFIGNGNVFDERLGFQRGFDVFDAITGDNDIWRPTARQVVDSALKFLETRTSPRFFLYVHVLDPHLPYVLESANKALFSEDKAAAQTPEKALLLDYDRAVRQSDDEFARLASALKRKGWWKAATVIYTADHGEEFYEHGGQGHGRTLFEEQVRVPLLVKFPGGEQAGTRRTDPVSLADVTPTLAALAGLPASPRWIGGDLRRNRFPRDRELYMIESLDDVRSYGLRRGPRKLIVELYPKYRRVIFDLDRDPSEKNGRDLACTFPDGRARDPLVAGAERWTARSVAAAPAIHLQKVRPEPFQVDFLVNLDSTPKPFLTAEEYCRFAPLAQGNRLEIKRTVSRDEPFALSVSADDHGSLPVTRLDVSTADGSRPLRVDAADSPLRMTRTEARYVQGPTSDELLRTLRSLGYLGGGQSSDHH